MPAIYLLGLTVVFLVSIRLVRGRIVIAFASALILIARFRFRFGKSVV